MSIGPVRTRERRTLRAVAGLTAVVLAVLVFASYKLVAGAGHAGESTTSRRTTAAGSTPGTPAPGPSASVTSAVPASPSVAPLKVQQLKPVSAAAFGPEGTADGDGAQQAGYVIDGNMATNWRSDWYATSRFGDLQAGTGLLIDMGRTMTISAVQVTLDSAPGADLELRAGNMATMADLPQVASSAGAGGTIQLKPANPARARYLLLWFTALPPDGFGTYQALVYNVSVTGQP